jgi:hypothetical protein
MPLRAAATSFAGNDEVEYQVNSITVAAVADAVHAPVIDFDYVARLHIDRLVADRKRYFFIRSYRYMDAVRMYQ